MDDNLWKDPFPPDMFAPSDEEIKNILDRAATSAPAGGSGTTWKDSRLLKGLAAAAAVIILAALGSRGLSYMFGETMLPRDRQQRSSQNLAAAATSAAAAATMAPAAEDRAALGGAATASPTATAAITSDGEAGTAQDAQTSGLEPPAASVYARAWDLLSQADAIAGGTLGNGTLEVKEILLGSCDKMISIPGDFSGEAIVLLHRTERGTLPLPKGPCVFLLSDGNAMGYDAAGARISHADLQESILRETCLELAEQRRAAP